MAKQPASKAKRRVKRPAFGLRGTLSPEPCSGIRDQCRNNLPLTAGEGEVIIAGMRRPNATKRGGTMMLPKE